MASRWPYFSTDVAPKRPWRIEPCQRTHGESTVIVDADDRIVAVIESPAWTDTPEQLAEYHRWHAEQEALLDADEYLEPLDIMVGRDRANLALLLRMVNGERAYPITVMRDGGASIATESHVAATLEEALTMAERTHAGRTDATFGIHPTDYPEALATGITFNEADGLLLDDDGGAK